MTRAARTVRLGDTDVPRIGLGSNRLMNTRPNVDFVRTAAAKGIGMIDTAHIYTRGDSERTIGEALEGLSPRPVVATKGAYAEGDGRAEVLRTQIDESLRRLRVERIDLYYLHRLHPQTPLEESLGVIAEYHEQGRIALAGLSAVSVEQIEQAQRVMPIAAVQNSYSVSERGSDEVVDYCVEHGIVFVPYYPLQFDESMLRHIAHEHGATAAQIALAWLLHRSPAMLPIPGTLSMTHLEENVGALDIELTEDEVEEIRSGVPRTA